jgi:hypothetical protein
MWSVTYHADRHLFNKLFMRSRHLHFIYPFQRWAVYQEKQLEFPHVFETLNEIWLQSPCLFLVVYLIWVHLHQMFLTPLPNSSDWSTASTIWCFCLFHPAIPQTRLTSHECCNNSQIHLKPEVMRGPNCVLHTVLGWMPRVKSCIFSSSCDSLLPQLLSSNAQYCKLSAACVSTKLTLWSFAVYFRVLETCLYRGADKSLARQGRKQATATEDFDVHISYL